MGREQREQLAAQLRGATWQQPATVEEERSGFAALMATMRVPQDVRRTPAELGGRPAVLVEPTGPVTRSGTILYLHGGSFRLGDPETAMSLTANLVVRTGMRALSLDYRLAPEHPFPAGLQDTLQAYRELLDQGVPAGDVVLAGDSAGGGLAVGGCLMARDAGLPVPGCVVTFSAGLDATWSGGSVRGKEGVDPFFTAAGLKASRDAYLGGADPRDPLASPAVTADLTGFPPLLLQVGTDELLLDDSVMLAERARDAEVDVTLDVTAGVPHVFQSYAGRLDEADRALERAALFITQHTAGGA